MNSRRSLRDTLVIAAALATMLMGEASAETFTVDDDCVRFSFVEEMGTPWDIKWKQGSNQDLRETSWWTLPKGMLQIHGIPGQPDGDSRERTSVPTEIVHAPGHYHATFVNPNYGSKTLDMWWSEEGVYIEAILNLDLPDLVIGSSWEPGGTNGDGNDYVKIYPETGAPYSVRVPYPGPPTYFFDASATAMGATDLDYDEVFGYRSSIPLRYKVGSGASLDGPTLFLPQGTMTVEFALTNSANWDEFVAGNWRIGPSKLLSVNANCLDTTFSATDGAYGRGVLSVSDEAHIVVEYDTGQVTHDDATFALSASLFSDDSSDNMAAGLFKGGLLLVQASDGDNLLTGDVIELQLSEVPNVVGLLAGTGLFEVTGGSLEDPFALDYGEIVQITFDIAPADLDDFSVGFDGISNITLQPVPEPATVSLMVLAGSILTLTRRRRKEGK